ncbi:penicillin acylase family protein [Cryobacterium sp. CG_9.6]|uniref:penicillin acylase family protein n=1 Tax=Cryobacterium sp. CG_9.6 TaxID=2760710 RepID=UPI002473B2E4|nr:penicillin acylase family protein [Cryobacterium sp. CG_9.6]MDH6236152.1 penicillin amidase [Cryobacterium sp. CG_9.6]
MGTDAPRSTRHRRLRRLFAGLGVLLTVMLVVAGLGVWTVTRSFPTLSGEVAIAGLQEPVTVLRDEAGIPQITASTASDLFMAEGYVHAQDRFWEMDFRRHVTAGRLSELFGESQVGTDTFVRTLGWRAVAEAEVALLDPETLGYFQSYADGVNAYLKTHRGADVAVEYAVLALQNPGYEPEPWTPADSVAWLKAMAWDLRSNLVDEIDRAQLATALDSTQISELYPAYPYDSHPTIVGGPPAATTAATTSTDTGAADAPATVFAASAGYASALASLQSSLESVPELLGPAGGDIGSNSWVVAGNLTDTGKPLLANDPHLGPALPSVWYQVGLRCSTVSAECPFDVAGYSFSGLPGVVIGHNARVAWGFTNLGPDVADLYLERVTGDTYEYDGAQKPLLVRSEKITVAGGPSVKITIRATEHGPIVSGLTGTEFPGIATDYPAAAGLAADPATVDPAVTTELSLQWTALTPGRTASAIFALNRATNWDTFRAAAANFDVPSQNLVYADVDGNIGYQAPGIIPIRVTGNGTVPVPGWTSQYGWSGYIPFDELPQVFNPPSGYIVAANNAAVGPDYPYLLTADWDRGYRADRITQHLTTLIDAGTPLTVNLMSEIQADNYSAIAAALVPALQAIAVTGQAADAQQLFEGWDFTVAADSAAAGYFNLVWHTLLSEVFDDTLPDGTEMTGSARSFAVVTQLLADPSSPWWTNKRLGTVNQAGMLKRVLEDAAAEGATRMGNDVSTWDWGRIHTLVLTNQSLGKSGVAPIEWLLNRGPYELGGGSSVVNAQGSDASVGFEVDWVPSMRQVISLGDFDQSTWINLTGASGHAFHRNYVDQTPLWQNHETRPWAFTPIALKTAATHTLQLTPTR